MDNSTPSTNRKKETKQLKSGVLTLLVMVPAKFVIAQILHQCIVSSLWTKATKEKNSHPHKPPMVTKKGLNHRNEFSPCTILVPRDRNVGSAQFC